MGNGEHESEPVAAGGSSRVPSRWVARIVIGVVLLGSGIGIYYWLLAPKPAPTRAPLPDLASLNEDPEDSSAPPDPGFLGPQACTPCHAARVAEFLKTPHARACRRPQDGPMPPGFERDRGRYTTAEPGLRFEMTQENGEFFQTAIQRTSQTVQTRRSRIDLVYGANKADEVFFSWRGDRLYELMTVWLHPTNQWAYSPYSRGRAGEFSREATTRCLECHTTYFRHVPGTVNEYDPKSFVLGATCEKCHGPGREHVAFHNAHPRSDDPHAIAQPASFSRERLIEVCTQCHANFTKPRGPVCRYRPGEPLDEYYRLSGAKNPEDDHVANQIKYLRESKCFQKSEMMTCVTCHDPHRPHDSKNEAAGRRSCLKCHTPDACSDRPNLPVAVRDDCVSCHMRKRVWMNVQFQTADDRFLPPVRRYEHRIARDPVARSEVLLAWHRSQPGESHRREADHLAAELTDHWLGEVDKLRHEYRFMAAIGAAREAVWLDPPPALRERANKALKDAIAVQSDLEDGAAAAQHDLETGRPDSAVARLNKLLSVKPNWAAAQNSLGTLYAATGQPQRAVEHLEAVARCDPDNASGLAMLGWLAYLGGRPDEAVARYAEADKIEPYDAKINYHWALALLKLSRWDEAAERFRQVITIDPRHAGGYEGLAHACRQLGRTAEAVRFAWRAARLTNFQETDVLITLAEAYSDARRWPEAAAAATKVIELGDADASGKGLPFDARRRMQEIRARAGY